MPELKKTFLKGKMNKDLDERIVPNGEYRDALNIEVSTSEGSNKGSAQTVRGNVELTPQLDNPTQTSYTIGPSATTVGSIVDESNGYIYNFVSKAAHLEDGIGGDGNKGTGIISDCIIQLKPKTNYSPSETTNLNFTPIITDVYEARYKPDPFAGNVITGLPLNGGLNIVSGIVIQKTEGIELGMRVQAIDSNGIDLWSGADIRVKQVSGNGNVLLTSTSALSSVYTAADKAAGVYIRFSKPRFLNFFSGTSELEANVGDGTSSSITPNKNIITGINIVDNFLMFSDGKTEPKKINIERFKKGTNSLRKSSRLYIKQDDQYVEVVNAAKEYVLVDESHISVIRPNPILAPTIATFSDGSNEAGAGPTEVVAQGSTDGGSAGTYGQFKIADAENDVYVTGNVFYIQTLTEIDIVAGDIISLLGADNGFTATATVTNVYSNNKYRVVLRTIDDGYDPAAVNAEFWVISRVKASSFYNESFVYLAYRYVYTDGEKSCISPYSTSAFIPGTYSYTPEDGFNFGVQNQADKFYIKDFALRNTPHDVVEIELIIRTTDSDNAYVFKSIKRTDAAFNNGGFVEIKTEQAGYAIPESQLLRSFDALPKSALAQEFASGRIMYGNYKQDYNLLDDSGNFINANVALNSKSIQTSFNSVVDGDGNFAAHRNVAQQTAILTTGGTVNAYESIILTQLFGGYVENTSNPWFQRLRRIADPTSGVSSDYFVDDNSYIYATNRGLYIGAQSLTDLGGNYSVLGEGTNASPHVQYYTAPVSGNYTFNMQIKATYSSSTASGTFHKWRVAIYECNDDGSMANLDSNYATTPDPVWVGNPLTGVQDFAIQNNQVLNNGQSLVPYQNTVEVYLVENKKYQVFILAKDEPWGINEESYNINSNLGEVTGFSTNGISDSISIPSGLVAGLSANPINIISAKVSVISSPSTTNSIPSTKGTKSVKSLRSYQVGVVYRDRYGRESSVIIDENNSFEIPKDFSSKKNIVTAKIYNNAPAWAETYKFFIKEAAKKYHNLVLQTVFDNNDGTFAWLVFNSADKDKVKIGDYLIQKKKHGTNDAVISNDAKWKIIDIQGEGVVGDGTITLGGVSIEQSIISEPSEIIGKFFVKVNLDTNFTTYLGSIENVQSADSANGAVFETEAKQKLDVDLYYEVGSAYPIRLTRDLASSYIKVGSTVEVDGAWGSSNLPNDFDLTIVLDELYENAEDINDAVVTGVIGSFGFPNDDAHTWYNDENTCRIYTDSSVNVPAWSGGADEAGLIFKIKQQDGSYVQVQQIGNITSGVIKVRPYTHPTSSHSTVRCEIALPWSNCISFGNGVESDTIRDDFNEDSMYIYSDSHKQSGFKSSFPQESYKEIHEKNKIIFSSIYNKDTNVNRINEFLIAENIVKNINPENGSVQKLFARDTDLVVLCESKVFRAPINKDVIFNADGNTQLVSSLKVIGTLQPYSSGDYGISKNPESFAADEFRIYFVDKDQGAVLRLSRDGITPIHLYGMEDWFNDNLKTAQAIIGSFDDKKGEYNLTIHDVTNPGLKKNVYTLSFDESINGWTSFKSFIPEQGVSLNNQYFTFKNADLYLHHYSEVNRNNFYGVDNDSTITTIFNDVPSSIKRFQTLSYEGTQSRVLQSLTDTNYYNIENKKGWYVDYINTDQQEGSVTEFIEKEGKWFNSIKGSELIYNNANEGVSTSNNLDIKESTTQGIGKLSGDATIVSGSISDSFVLTFNNTLNNNYIGQFEIQGLSLFNITSLDDLTTNTFTISPLPGFVISATDFANTANSPYYSSVSFADTGTPNSPSNTVEVTINWINQAITQDDLLNFEINSASQLASGYSWNSILYATSFPAPGGGNTDNQISFQPGLISPTATEQPGTYILSGIAPIEEEFELIKFSIFPAAGHIFSGYTIGDVQVVESTLPSAWVQNYDTIDAVQYLVETNFLTNNQGFVSQIDFCFNAYAFENVELSDNNLEIGVNVGNSYSIYAYWAVSTHPITDETLSTTLQIFTNGAAPTFEIEAAATWITNVEIVDNIAGQPYTQVIVTTQANTTFLERQGDITMYSSADINQENGQTITLLQSGDTFIDLFKTNAAGVIVSETSVTVGPGTSTGFFLTVVINDNPSVYEPTDFTVSVVDADDGGSAPWLAGGGFDYDIDTSAYQPGDNLVAMNLFLPRIINTGSSDRSATVTVTHPDGITTATFNVTQQNTYNSSTDTVEFVDVNGDPLSSVNLESGVTSYTGYLNTSSDVAPSLQFDTTNPQFDAFISNWVVSQPTPSSEAPDFEFNVTLPIVNIPGVVVLADLQAFYQSSGSNLLSNNTSNEDDLLTINSFSPPASAFTDPSNPGFDIPPPDLSYTYTVPSGPLEGYQYYYLVLNNDLTNTVAPDISYNSPNFYQFYIISTSSIDYSQEGLMYFKIANSSGPVSINTVNLNTVNANNPNLPPNSTATVLTNDSKPYFVDFVNVTTETVSGGYLHDVRIGFDTFTNSGNPMTLLIHLFADVSEQIPRQTLVVQINSPD